MTTRRDSEVTPGHRVLFDEVRGLFRHAPFTDGEFALLAPSLSYTLSPGARDKALPIFWDILDAQERDTKMDALITLLGFSHHSGNVLDRKNALDHEIHPRTHARRADEAIRRVLHYIDARFSIQFASVHIRYAQPHPHKVDMAWLSIYVDHRGVMDTPTLELDGEEISVEIKPEGRWQELFDQELPALPEVTIGWEGTLRPTFNLWGRSSEPLMLHTYPHGCNAIWG